MYRKIILTICVCNFAIAAVIPAGKDATILNYDYENDGRGNYHFSYITSNGIKRNETGQLVNVGQKNEYTAVQGFYAFEDVDGNYRVFEYNADENGYHVNSTVHPVPSHTYKEQISYKFDEGLNLPAGEGVSSALLASLLGGG